MNTAPDVSPDSESEPDVRSFIVPQPAAGARLDVFLAQSMEDRSRAELQECIQKGLVRVDEVPVTKKNRRLTAGEEVIVELPPPTPTVLLPSPEPLAVIYEDRDILVIDKPPGVTVHPGVATGADTLVHRLIHHLGPGVVLPGHPLRPGIVHRLDRETSGLMVIAKSDTAYLRLVAAFASRTMHKVYRALVFGSPAAESGSWQQPIGRHPTVRVKMAVVANGKPAHTDWRRLQRLGTSASLLQCTLHSGRTHQIRVHSAHAGLPLLGDTTYGFRPSRFTGPPVPRVMLHAAELGFAHPITQHPLTFQSADPDDFSQVLEALKE